MAARAIAVAAALVFALSSSAAAQPATRLNDFEVRDQMEEVQQMLDRFATSLGPQMRAAPAIRPLLDDLRSAATRMAGAYNPPRRMADAEVADVLSRARALEAAMKAGSAPPGSEGRWAEIRRDLVDLGRAYQIDWSSEPATWAPRRICDRELRLAAASLAAAARDLCETMDVTLRKDRLTNATEKDRAARQLDAFSDAAGDLLAALRHGDEMSIALARVTRASAELKPFMDHYAGATPVQPQWQSADKALGTIARAFGLPR